MKNPFEFTQDNSPRQDFEWAEPSNLEQMRKLRDAMEVILRYYPNSQQEIIEFFHDIDVKESAVRL